MITQFETLKHEIFNNPNIRIQKTPDDEYVVLSGKQKVLKVYSGPDISTLYIWDNKENRFNPVATTRVDLKKDNLFDINARDILDIYYKSASIYEAKKLPANNVLPRTLKDSEKLVLERAFSSLRQR